MDKLYSRRGIIERLLTERQKTLFDLDDTIYLYDLTSTYFEGECHFNPQAEHGYSKDKRFDCKQVIVGLVIDPDGFPKTHEVSPGSKKDSTTISEMLHILEKRVDKRKAATVMVDRGMAFPENIDEIKEKGYDEKGAPFAPCGALCRPNGCDEKKRRVHFVCQKQCLTSSFAVPNPMENCRYLANECGSSTHMSSTAHPRLVCEIPRCSDRWKKIRNLRSASERSNGTTKSSDLDIFESPRIYGLKMASVETTIACITALLKRMMRFVIGITLNLTRYLKTSQ